MSVEKEKHPKNVPGKFYVTEDCLACAACEYSAPNNFRLEEGSSYVYKQPTTPEEEKQCQEAMEGCCVEAIWDDGISIDSPEE
jgi:ferredoxin